MKKQIENRFAEVLLDTIGNLPPREAIEKLMTAGLVDIRACERQAIYNEVRRAERAGIYAQTYNNVDILTKRHTKELDYYRERSRHMSYKITRHISDALDEEPQKVILIRLQHDGKLEEFQKRNRAWAIGKCNSFFSCREYLEYCPLDTDKGTGVDYLVHQLNLPKTSTVAVGDEQNDIPMLARAHIGIAMKNGIDEIKEEADYITEQDNNHDAIAEVIDRFIL